jgi:tetratricopeptide (TPR) repeat protein
VAKIAGNLYVEAAALRVEAVCWQYLGNYSRCLSLLNRAMSLLFLCGMRGGGLDNYIRTTQAEVHRLKSEYVEAHHIQLCIRQDFSADQNPYEHALALLNIAQIEVEVRGSVQAVQQNINTAAGLFQKINFSAGITYCDMLRAALDVQAGNFLGARTLFQKCLRSTWGKDHEAVTYCLEKLSSVSQWSAADQTSSPWPVVLLVHSVKSERKLQLHKALQFLGDVFKAQGEQDTAISLFTVALNGFTQMDVHCSRAECMVRLGDISLQNGDDVKAGELWELAKPLFERSSQSKQLVELNSKLASLCHNR